MYEGTGYCGWFYTWDGRPWLYKEVEYRNKREQTRK